MKRLAFVPALAIAVCAAAALAQQGGGGPYKVLKTARVGGEGGWDYIYADTAGRRLYIPRRGSAAQPATATRPATLAVPTRLTIYNLDTLAPAGEIPDVGGQGAAVDPKSGHGFTSSRPISMFDTKTEKLIKTIDAGPQTQPDGIYFDPPSERVYVFSHPTKDATVIDAKDGNVVGKIDLGGTPEQAVGDGRGTLYVVMQDAEGSVAVVDTKAMKTTTHYPFGDKGACNGLALDVKNGVLFAMCGRSGNPPANPAVPMMVILSARDGKILANLPLAGGSDGAVFNPETMEAFSTGGNGTLTVVKETNPTTFVSEQTLQTMNGARTITMDAKTGRLFTMAQEFGPPPANAPATGRGPARGAVVPGSFTILMIGR